VAWTRQELEQGKLIWLLEISVRGRVFRFSTEPAEVTNSNVQVGPITYQYRSGLEFLDYEDTVGLFESEASNREVSLSVLFGPGAADGWQVISNPETEIGSGIGELSLWLQGDDYQDRQVIIRGNLEEPTHGSQNEPIAFTLTESDWHDPAQFPPKQSKVDLKTWPRTTSGGDDLQADDKARDQYYPWIFGQPGSSPPEQWHGGGVSRFAATPGLIAKINVDDGDNLVDAATVVVAGHRVGAASVDVWNADIGGWLTGIAVANTSDGRGRDIATISYTASSTTTAKYITPGTELWIAWTGDGGIRDETNTRPLTGAGEVIRYLLDRSQLRIDTLRSRIVLDEIDGYTLDFWINEPRSPWEIIAEDILPLVPLSPQVTAEGLGFVYWAWDATAADAVRAIDIGRDFGERLSEVEVSPFSEVFNVIRIDYCVTGPEGNPVKSLTYSHADTDRDAGILHNPYSYASFTRYGSREGLIIDAPIVESDGTARAILDWKIRFHSQTHRTVTYRLGQSAQAYEVGDVVTLTDTEINWDQAVCLITGIVRRPGQTEVTFTTVSHWTRDALVP